MTLNKNQSRLEIVEKLKRISFFKSFSENEEIIGKIVEICSFKSFKKGKEIIKEGDLGDELYILLNGEIEILKKTLQNEKYVVATLSSKDENSYVGELGLIDNDRRSATVIAKNNCDCLVISRDGFILFGDENPSAGLEITRAIATQLSVRLRKTNTDIITLFSALVEEIAEEE